MSDPLDIIFTRRNGAGTGHEQIDVPERANGTFGTDEAGNIVARTPAEQLAASNVLVYSLESANYVAGLNQAILTFAEPLTGVYLLHGAFYGEPTDVYALELVNSSAHKGLCSNGSTLASVFTGGEDLGTLHVSFTGKVELTASTGFLLDVEPTFALNNFELHFTLTKLN